MKRLLRLIALVLTVAMLSGCRSSILMRLAVEQLLATEPGERRSGEMVYVRPDLEAHDRVLKEACEIARTETDIDLVLDAVYEYYDAYDLIYAAYDLSYLHYCADMTDSYWSEEYAYCADNIGTVDDGLDSLYYALAESPILSQLEQEAYFGPGYFDYYAGGEPESDPALDALWDQEAELIDRYYRILEDSENAEDYTDTWYDSFGTQLEQVYLELIRVRQQQAEHLGYDSYPDFAFDYYHYRDYTPEEAARYLQAVGDLFADLYRDVVSSDIWELGWQSSTQQETFRYVKTCAEAMGADVAKAFAHLEEKELYDIGRGANKYPGSFEVYILYYYQPFIFLCPDETVYDKLAFAHEFGHFAADHICGGTYAGTDVTEVHSQAMEYLSLLYGEDTEQLHKLKLADSLCTYVEQSAYALFEQKVYDLEGNDLTAENLRALYTRIGTDFGFDAEDWDPREYVTVPHFFEQPLYVISYVVSNDLAMQIYQMETEDPGAGLEVYEEILRSEETYIMTFAEDHGLISPFAPGRAEAVRKTFETVLD